MTFPVAISPQSTEPQPTRSRQINQTCQNHLSFAIPSGSSSMKSFFGQVLAGSPMLHAQLRRKQRFIKAPTPYFRFISEHMFSHSLQPNLSIHCGTWAHNHALNITCHAPYTSRESSIFVRTLSQSYFNSIKFSKKKVHRLCVTELICLTDLQNCRKR